MGSWPGCTSTELTHRSSWQSCPDPGDTSAVRALLCRKLIGRERPLDTARTALADLARIRRVVSEPADDRDDYPHHGNRPWTWLGDRCRVAKPRSLSRSITAPGTP